MPQRAHVMGGRSGESALGGWFIMHMTKTVLVRIAILAAFLTAFVTILLIVVAD